jgi:hypothetical protein
MSSKSFATFIADDHYTLAVADAIRSLLVGRGRSESALTKEERIERDRLAAAAVAALRDAFALGLRCAPLLRSDPNFASIRSLASFQELVRRVEASAQAVKGSNSLVPASRMLRLDDWEAAVGHTMAQCSRSSCCVHSSRSRCNRRRLWVVGQTLEFGA